MCNFLVWKVKALFAQSCLIVCNPTECSLPGSSVHVILQARILEWAAIPFFRGSSWLRDWTPVSCIAGRFFTVWATREAHTSLRTGGWEEPVVVPSLWEERGACSGSRLVRRDRQKQVDKEEMHSEAFLWLDHRQSALLSTDDVAHFQGAWWLTLMQTESLIIL